MTRRRVLIGLAAIALAIWFNHASSARCVDGDTGGDRCTSSSAQ